MGSIVSVVPSRGSERCAPIWPAGRSWPSGKIRDRSCRPGPVSTCWRSGQSAGPCLRGLAERGWPEVVPPGESAQVYRITGQDHGMRRILAVGGRVGYYRLMNHREKELTYDGWQEKQLA